MKKKIIIHRVDNYVPGTYVYVIGRYADRFTVTGISIVCRSVWLLQKQDRTQVATERVAVASRSFHNNLRLCASRGATNQVWQLTRVSPTGYSTAGVTTSHFFFFFLNFEYRTGTLYYQSQKSKRPEPIEISFLYSKVIRNTYLKIVQTHAFPVKR